MVKILIADDEPDVVEVITVGLRMNSPDWEIISAEDGQMAVELFRKENPDLVILDINMPRLSGLETCHIIRREHADVPIIFLTVRDDEIEKVRGLEAGADDYIIKPFSSLELVARIRAQLRRTMSSKATAIKNMVEYQGLKIDFVTKNVTLDNHPVRLTSIEYNLLYLLANNPGRVVSHDYLLTKIWGPQYQDALDYLKVHIRHLREKLGDDAQNPRFIFTERSKGYRFTALPE
ncbi:response regulator transcription factor [Candidatus Chlorohelix sp.]|uniref:response regulator transcription factor n=1 Tax=Candidatus Chlorohelix sp. TaxID=3139201 RepID=UPI00304F1DC8